ncbi:MULTISPECIES: 2-oxo-4-hydroxy-4-carboxy-5-ureidoimidazoline decarboxylase [Streptomyces]|uniref:2-oxo-4-hydroxy-4-carboxy-5-ureidoimidazoline decarboxylase n=1 Tax=Streptomyces TaxID=1883 RepID=UPI0027DD194E|nr:2-oxo-4-hydroxy-4-carboxy-5-ureidoimidazoline decarboxylase [Streptomyces sp. 9-7]
MASSFVTPFPGLFWNHRIPPGCRVPRTTATPVAASFRVPASVRFPQLPSVARPAPVEPFRSHPSEEPTLSGDTPAARPTLRPQPARCGIPSQVPSAALPRPRPDGTGLRRLNALDRDAALAVLLGCCGSREWAGQLADRRPYRDPEALLAAADRAFAGLPPAGLDEALAAESPPRPPAGTHGLGAPGAPAARTALNAAYAAYEQRFRHAFVICLDGCREEEALDQILFGIRMRLGNGPDEERSVTAEQLRRVARGRLRRLVA